VKTLVGCDLGVSRFQETMERQNWEMNENAELKDEGKPGTEGLLLRTETPSPKILTPTNILQNAGKGLRVQGRAHMTL
jgi:hypothetical protein